MVDKVERTVSEYACLRVKRAHVQRPLFGIMPVIKGQITALRRHNA
jgi:hypothetical protein